MIYSTLSTDVPIRGMGMCAGEVVSDASMDSATHIVCQNTSLALAHDETESEKEKTKDNEKKREKR